MRITAPLSRIKINLIRQPLWLIWYPILFVHLTLDHVKSPNYKKIIWVTWRMGWKGIA